MDKAYPPSIKGNRTPFSRLHCDEDNSEADLDTEVISLLEENARLRALVTQLSDLVLKHVVDQK